MKSNYKNDSVDKALECIQKSVKMINNSLLDLKSLNNINPSICSVKNLIEESISLSVVYIHDKEITISSEIKADGDIFVDENKFLACMINLIKNAIEAIEQKGKILITSETDGENIIIKVANNGNPISEKAYNQIFSEGYTTKKTGSGLGLFICKNNLQEQNAMLSLTQSTTEKTEFQIVIKKADS